MTRAEIEDLIKRFSTAGLTAVEWTHTAHLVVGLWHADQFQPDHALARMRAGILRLNEHHGTPNTPTRGYHETITRAYLELLAQFVAMSGAETFEERVAALLASPLSHRDMLSQYYSREVLMSPAARAAWTAPDRAPLQLALTRPGRLNS